VGKILALDYGSQRVGIAISDEAGQHAFPRAAVPGGDRSKLISALEKIIVSESVERIVIGLPLTLRGETGPQAAEVLAATRDFSSALNVPVDFEDERMSSSLADRYSDSSFSRDSLAAAAILESYLERRHNHGVQQSPRV